MELVTAIEFDGVTKFPPLGKRLSLCTISRKNLLAFTAPRCYKLKKGHDEKQANSVKLSDCDFGGVADTLFVCPLSSPWNVHVVVPMDCEIKHIVWDSSGTKLLTADASGQVFLWQMQESLINKWAYTNFTRSLYGDDIIALKWITSTQLLTIAKDSREHSAYEKKFPLASMNPAVGSFGGRSLDAWAAVTSAGVVAVGIVHQKTEMIVTRVALETFEDRMLKCADIVLEANGSAQILTTTGRTKDPIRLHKLTADITSNGYYIQSGQCVVACDCFSCFFVDKCTENDTISSVQCVQPISGSVVLVAIDKPHGTEIQQWTMCEETLGLHTAFHANTIIPEKNLHWIRQTSAQFTSYVTAYATNPLITDNTTLLPFGSAFACDDQVLRLISRLSLSDTQSCPTELTNDNEKIVTLSISPNGCVCVAMTTECRMLVFRSSNVTVEQLTTLLEYDMCTGVGFEDVVLCLKSDSSLADKVLQSITVSLSKQTSGLQNQFKTRMDMLKVALSMSSETGLAVSADQLTALLLHHINYSFIAVLSSSNYDESEQNAEEKFRWVLGLPGNNVEQDVDKLISMLEPVNDFLPDESVVGSLQPLVQWVCDLTMTLLSSLPIYYSYGMHSGSWLLKDLHSLYTLRELLLLIRLWYNTVPKIRPVLSCSMSFDVLAKLFKLLTMLIVSVKEGNSLQATLADECILLANQLVLPPFERSICWSEIPISISLDTGNRRVFGEQTGGIGCLRVPAGQYTTNGRKDIYTQIAINTDEYKRCIRCHAMTLLTRQTSDQKNRLNVTSHYCICGGLWCLNT